MSRPKKARTGWSQDEDNLDAEQQNAESRYQKEISIPKRRLRTPRYHKKDISIPKKDATHWNSYFEIDGIWLKKWQLIEKMTENRSKRIQCRRESPWGALRSPYRAFLFCCLLVRSLSPGFDCIGPRAPLRVQVSAKPTLSIFYLRQKEALKCFNLLRLRQFLDVVANVKSNLKRVEQWPLKVSKISSKGRLRK